VNNTDDNAKTVGLGLQLRHDIAIACAPFPARARCDAAPARPVRHARQRRATQRARKHGTAAGASPSSRVYFFFQTTDHPAVGKLDQVDRRLGVDVAGRPAHFTLRSLRRQ